METVRFEDLGLRPQILRAVMEMGFEAATPIQARAMPIIMKGCNRTGADRNRKDGGVWHSPSGED